MRETERRGLMQDVPQNPGYLRDLEERNQQRDAWACWQTLDAMCGRHLPKGGLQGLPMTLESSSESRRRPRGGA